MPRGFRPSPSGIVPPPVSFPGPPAWPPGPSGGLPDPSSPQPGPPAAPVQAGLPESLLHLQNLPRKDRRKKRPPPSALPAPSEGCPFAGIPSGISPCQPVLSIRRGAPCPSFRPPRRFPGPPSADALPRRDPFRRRVPSAPPGGGHTLFGEFPAVSFSRQGRGSGFPGCRRAISGHFPEGRSSFPCPPSPGPSAATHSSVPAGRPPERADPPPECCRCQGAAACL